MRPTLVGLVLLTALPGCLNDPGPAPMADTEQVGTGVPAEHAEAGLPSNVNFRGAMTISGNDLSLAAEDFAFAPTVAEASPGTTVEVTVSNPSDSVHTFTSERLGVDETVGPGDTAEVAVTLPEEGPVRFVCALHEGAGMAGAFVLGGTASTRPETATVSDAGPASALSDAATVAGEQTAVPLAEALAQAGNVEGVGASGAVLRADLASLIGEDAFLTGLAMRQRLAGRAGVFPDAMTALDRSAVDLADRIGAIRGVSDGQRDTFLAQWRAHTDALLDYADAAEAGMDRAKTRPLEELTRLERDLGLLMEDLTHGQIGDRQFASGLGEESQALREAAEALAAQNPAATESIRMAAAGATERVAVPLAEAFAESRDLPGVQSKAATLREKLVSGFGDHVFLVGMAAERAEDPRDLEAARDAVHANALEIAHALESSDVITNKREKFLNGWDAHVAALLDDRDPRAPLDHLAALLAGASGDAATREEVRAWLDAYAEAITDALAAIG